MYVFMHISVCSLQLTVSKKGSHDPDNENSYKLVFHIIFENNNEKYLISYEHQRIFIKSFLFHVKNSLSLHDTLCRGMTAI